MRILDCKSPVCSALAAEAPVILDYLCDDCAAHFQAVKGCLEEAELPYTVDPRIVRGLDYYTRTVFEFVSDALGAQAVVCGGGRYDGLCQELGGPSIPSLGFGMGLERLLLVMEAKGCAFPAPPNASYIWLLWERPPSAAASPSPPACGRAAWRWNSTSPAGG